MERLEGRTLPDWESYLNSVGHAVEKMFPQGNWWNAHPSEKPNNTPNPWKGMKTGWTDPFVSTGD